jgi:hypothetical protein
MANYLIQSCDEVTSYVVDSGLNTIVIGNLYYFTFTGGTTPICGTVISEDNINPIDDGINSVTEYQNCLECLQDNGFSFLVTGCTLPIGGPVSTVQFNEWPLGNFYTLCANNGEFEGCLCFEVIGVEPGVYPFSFTKSGPYLDCDCQGIPRSANTETDLCIEICTPEGGKTVVSVNPPHPVWTDGYGTQVTELNMITLGGQNGLNN